MISLNRFKKLIVSIIVYSFFFSFPCRAVILNNISVSDGLSNNDVYDIIQDKNGYIWVATEYGLNKIIDKNISVFNEKDGLYSSSILCFDLTDDGIIWVGTQKGLNYIINNKIYKFLDDSYVNEPTQLIVEKYFIYYRDKRGILTVVDKTNLIKKNFFENFQNDINGIVNSILRIGDGSIYVSTDYGLYRFLGFTFQKVLDNTKISLIQIKNKNNLLYIESDKLIEHNINENKKRTLFKLKTKNYSIVDLKYTKLNKIFLIIHHLDSYLFYIYNINDNTVSSINLRMLLNTFINKFYIDKFFNIWIGTFGNGLFYFKYFDKLKKSSFNIGVKKIYVNDFITINNKTYISSNNGLNVKHENNLLNNELNLKNLFSGYTRSLYFHKNKLYVSITNNTLIKNAFFKRFLYNNDTIIFIYSKYIYLDTLNNLLFVDHYLNNIFVYSIDNLNLLNKIPKPYLKYDIYLNTVKLYNGYYILGTTKGIIITDFHLKKILFKYLNFFCYDIFIHNNSAYILTNTGVYKLHIDKNKNIFNIEYFIFFNNFIIYKIIKSKYNFILNSSYGIFVYKPNSYIFKIDSKLYDNSDVKNIKIYNNNLNISTSQGFVVLDINDLYSYNYSFFDLDEFYLYFNSSDFIQDFYDSSLYTTDKRNILFNIRKLNITNNNYYIRLKYNNSEWITLDYPNNTSYNFISPKPGFYIFYFQFSKDNINWSDNIILKVYFKPFWYEKQFVKILFLFLLFILISSPIITFIYIRKNKITKENLILDLKLKALNSSINSHFIYNSLNSLQYFINTNQNTLASNFIYEFSRFLRNIVDNSNEINTSLYNELNKINHYINLESIRYVNKFTFNIYIDDDIKPEKILFPNMILQPLVENAIIHGILKINEHGIITINISKKNKFLHILITDNGPGYYSSSHISEYPDKKSIGISIVKERIKLFSGNLKHSFRIIDRSFFGQRGTIVEIFLPIIYIK